MLGDEGSGYWIGRAALRAVLREADQPRAADGADAAAAASTSASPRRQDLIHEVYQTTCGRRRSARWRSASQAAFRDGDSVAIGILRGAADELEVRRA